jgi:outer membrane immunogenic protein
MKRLATAIAAVALIGTPALAADMAVKAPPPPPAPAPVFSWTGFYAGLNAGGIWERDSIETAVTPIACADPSVCPALFAATSAATSAQLSTPATSFIGGVQIGYNYQTGPLVWGIETDFQGTNLKGTGAGANSVQTTCCTDVITVTAAVSEKLDWLGTVRGRVGWLPVNTLLAYATGGLAYGKVQTAAAFSLSDPQALSPVNVSSSLSQSDTRTGWTVGGGLEWLFAPQWSVKAEYLHYDLGTVTLNQPITAVFGPLVNEFWTSNFQSTAHYRGDIVRVGLNYQFH